ncbi:MICOS complex subunit Mic10-like [Lytechinus variegatus]|uniref:MICOS complex subunit Mic10-like n=1 Tax=Lytechinus variegatus TaxID=7654 RepID=UPI001BB26AD1|nr:MICOS complex subunit Mic10-like [Lytechinus variegatus]
MADKNSVGSEAVLGQKWDRCVSDTLIKIGGGLGLGVVFSVFLFKRRPWPIAFGSGVGLGMGYANCQHEFRDPFQVRGKIVKVLPDIVADVPKAVEVQATTEASSS